MPRFNRRGPWPRGLRPNFGYASSLDARRNHRALNPLAWSCRRAMITSTQEAKDAPMQQAEPNRNSDPDTAPLIPICLLIYWISCWSPGWYSQLARSRGSSAHASERCSAPLLDKVVIRPGFNGGREIQPMTNGGGEIRHASIYFLDCAN
jgi:hypothetical protein